MKTINLLVLYEISEKASRVTTKQAYVEFEKWVRSVIEQYKDAAVERVARTQLFKLKDQFAF